MKKIKILLVFSAIMMLFLVTAVSAECKLSNKAKEYAKENNLGLPTHKQACEMLEYRANHYSDRCDIILPKTKYRDEIVYKKIGVWGRNSLTGEKDICFVPGSGNKKKNTDSSSITPPTPPVEEPKCSIEKIKDCVKEEKQKVCVEDVCHYEWVCVEEKVFEQLMCKNENWNFDCSSWTCEKPYRERTCEFTKVEEE